MPHMGPSPISSPPEGGTPQKIPHPVVRYIVLALLIGALALTLIPSLFLATLSVWFTWSAAISLLDAHASKTPWERPVRWAHAITGEINALGALIALFPLTFSKTYLRPRGRPEGRPILLVHGFLSFASTWHYHRARLVEAGLGPVYCLNIGSFQSIAVYAEKMRAKVKEIERETGRSDLDLVGHSKGGLVSSYYTAHFAKRDGVQIKRLITLGSPLNGSPVAPYFPGYDAKEMSPGHPFLEKLQDAVNQFRETEVTHIGSLTDELVPLASSLPEKDKWPHRMIDGEGHIGILFSRAVAEEIRKALS